MEGKMGRRALGWLLAGFLAAGCAGGQSSAPSPPPVAQPTATGTPSTPQPLEPPGSSPSVRIPKTFATLNKRDWAKVVKDPDKYVGKGYHLWGCITQFDAATGPDSFRADASYHKETYWKLYGENSLFSGSERQLSDYVTGDAVVMNVVGLGSFSYDTQIGGNTTVPLFQVVSIGHKGSCD
jgi:hypothetical protein